MNHPAQPRRSRWAAALMATALTGFAPAGGPPIVVSTTDGEWLEGELVGIAGRGREANLQLRVGSDVRTVPVARVIGLHGPGPQPVPGAVIHLVGGDQLRGELHGSDASGESFIVRSRSLGELSVPIDRLRVVILPGADPSARPEDFSLPEGAKSDEAVFLKAQRGYDTYIGAIHRFTAEGVSFEWIERAAPELFRYEKLAAIALRQGVPREATPGAQLVTRSGDVVGVDLAGFRDGQLLFSGEGERELAVPLADVSALTFFGESRVFLSEVDPVRVAEQGTPFEEAAAPLYPFRRDRAATGGFLVVGGRTHGKGIGAHSRCELTYRVPEGCDLFSAAVGIDDSVLATPIRGIADVVVEVDGKSVFAQTVRGGEAARQIHLPVEPGKLLTLKVDFGDGWFVGDRVDWLSALFARQP